MFAVLFENQDARRWHLGMVYRDAEPHDSDILCARRSSGKLSIEVAML